MYVAGAIAIVGFLAVAAATQFYGLRLGGTVTVPLLAVYALRDPLTVLLFVVVTLVVFGVLQLVITRTLVYGRTLFTLAVLSSISASVIVSLLFNIPVGTAAIGSILPGIAAYNFQRVENEAKVAEISGTIGLFFGLVSLGIFGTHPLIATAMPRTAPVVLAADSAALNVFGFDGYKPEGSSIGNRIDFAALFIIGAIIAEWVRSRYDMRLGVVTVPLLALFLLTDVTLFATFVVAVALSLTVGIAVHWLSLLYGRVLLGIMAAVSVGGATLVAVPLPVEHGVSAFVAGIIGGVTAYNLHATGLRNIVTVVPAYAALLGVLLSVGLVVVGSRPDAVVTSSTPSVFLILLFVTLLGSGIVAFFSTGRKSITEGVSEP